MAGFNDISHKMNGSELETTAWRVTDSLVHRGSDDSIIWVDDRVEVSFGHRRHSILDLSPEGYQPMTSACGRYVIAFNGEVYNYQKLGGKLEGQPYCITPAWHGHSETEVMLASISCWGLEATVKCFVGIFAFALWDREARVLSLVRDRMGEKPLYCGWAGKSFLFGSELKALCAHPDFRPEINRDALALFLRHNYIPAPYSIYRDIFKLLPGTILSMPLSAAEARYSPAAYWSVRECAEAGEREPFSGTEDEAITCLASLIGESVSRQMVADVPLGAFLSGGVDSSTVVALMQTRSTRPVKTFTIGFTEKEYNEADHAKVVADYLAAEHTELYVTPKEAMEVIPCLPRLYDEPFSDASQIPTFLVSQLARRHVTVSLSGDGGDELFGGYNRYFWGWSIWRKTGRLPAAVKSAARLALTFLSSQGWDAFFDKGGFLLPRGMKQKTPGDKLRKLAEIIAAKSPEEVYLGLVSHWKRPADMVVGIHEPPTALSGKKSGLTSPILPIA